MYPVSEEEREVLVSGRAAICMLRLSRKHNKSLLKLLSRVISIVKSKRELELCYKKINLILSNWIVIMLQNKISKFAYNAAPV